MSRDSPGVEVEERFAYRRGRPLHALGALFLLFTPIAFAIREPPLYVASAVSTILVIGLAIYAARENGKGFGLTVLKHGIECGSFFLPRPIELAGFIARVRSLRTGAENNKGARARVTAAFASDEVLRARISGRSWREVAYRWPSA
jgi:hypothetical protein